MSDEVTSDTWAPNVLLQRPRQAPNFLRQDWDSATKQAFGPWNLNPKTDPLSGQTEAVIAPDSGLPEDVILETASTPPPFVESIATEPQNTLTQEQCEELVAQAKAEGHRLGHQVAMTEMESKLEAERGLLHSISQALQTLQSDRNAWLVPLKKLALQLAQELVRSELKQNPEAIDRLIQACLDALGPSGDMVTVFVSAQDRVHLQDQRFPGVTFEVDEMMPVGSVRAQVHDSVVEDLMSYKLAQLSQQILGDVP